MKDNPLCPALIDLQAHLSQRDGESDLYEIVGLMLRYLDGQDVDKEDDRCVELIHQALIVRSNGDWKVEVDCMKCGKLYNTITRRLLWENPLKVAAVLVQLHRERKFAEFNHCPACGGVAWERIGDQ